MTQVNEKPLADEDVPEWVGAYRSTCIGCTQTDNHPKMQVGPINAPPVFWHHDCYVIAKAPGWEQVADSIAGANGATGHALRLHLMGQSPTSQQEG